MARPLNKKIKLNCDYCGAPFTRYECSMRGEHHFCNHRCSGLYYRENTGKTHFNENFLKASKRWHKVRKLRLYGDQQHVLTSEEIDNIPGI